jgi:hypothetical protein
MDDLQLKKDRDAAAEGILEIEKLVAEGASEHDMAGLSRAVGELIAKLPASKRSDLGMQLEAACKRLQG